MPVAPSVAETGANGAVEPLDRQMLRSPLLRMPPSRAPITARLLTALNQNGAAIPILAAITPLKAGPRARLTLMPTPFAATA